MSRQQWTLGLMVVAMLTVARPSWALLDWIWELSGPSMIGTGGYCSIQFDREGGLCDEYGYLVVFQKNRVKKRIWLRAQSTVLFSTWKNPTDSQIYATTFVAMLQGSWTKPGNLPMVYSGVGYSGNVFFGPGFDSYNNPAFIVTPLGIRFRALGLLWTGDFNIRWFDKTFNPVDVSNPLPESERTIGFTLTAIIGGARL